MNPPQPPLRGGLSKSPRPHALVIAPTPPKLMSGSSIIPFEVRGEVARLTRAARGGNDVVTDDALLAGWLQTKWSTGAWVPRFYQLRSGSLLSFACSAVHSAALNDRTAVRNSKVEAPVAGVAPEVSCRLQFCETDSASNVNNSRASVRFILPELLCTETQYASVRSSLEQRKQPTNNNNNNINNNNNNSAAVPTRLVICWRAKDDGSVVAVLVRLSAQSLLVFDLEDALEYTLACLSLEASDEPASADFPFGLVVSSGQADEMIVPLRNLIVAAPSPLMVLQWMSALKDADLDPPIPKGTSGALLASGMGGGGVSGGVSGGSGNNNSSLLHVQPREPRSGLRGGKSANDNSTGGGSKLGGQTRSSSGSLVGQLLSDAVGAPMSNFSNQVATTDSPSATKANLEKELRSLPWDVNNPLSLHDAMKLEGFQQALCSFCKTIFTEENVNFWIGVERFRGLRNDVQRATAARALVSEFINYSGKSVVNIAPATRRRIEEAVANATMTVSADVFDAALVEVTKLLEEDSWGKFVNRMQELHGGSFATDDNDSWDSDDSSSYEERRRKQEATAKAAVAAKSSSSVQQHQHQQQQARIGSSSPKSPSNFGGRMGGGAAVGGTASAVSATVSVAPEKRHSNPNLSNSGGGGNNNTTTSTSVGGSGSGGGSNLLGANRTRVPLSSRGSSQSADSVPPANPISPRGIGELTRERSGSLLMVGGNDFGESFTEEEAVDMDSLKQQLAQAIRYDPNDVPPLRFLLAKKNLRGLMRLFAKTILADENVDFWETAMRFHYAEDLPSRQVHLRTLFEDFIPVGSKTMVNIAGSERARLMKLYKEQGDGLAANRDLFDTAVAECVKVMELDLYPKFLKLMQECCTSGPNTPPSRNSLSRPKAPPLWEMLNDPDQLNALLLFAASHNQQDELLFWCLVQRFRAELDAEMRGRLGSYLVQFYVANAAPRAFRVDKAKRGACLERYEQCRKANAALPADLFDALWRDVQTSMNKTLHPSYEKSLRKSKKAGATPSGPMSGNMLKQELEEAMKEEEKRQKWVKPTAQGQGEEKKSLLGGTRKKIVGGIVGGGGVGMGNK